MSVTLTRRYFCQYLFVYLYCMDFNLALHFVEEPIWGEGPGILRGLVALCWQKVQERRVELTAPISLLPFTMSTIWRAMSSPQRAWASFVLAPRWGQLMTPGCSTRERSLGGSCRHRHGWVITYASWSIRQFYLWSKCPSPASTKTSSPAPPHCPDSKARRRAASSMMPPRAQFTTFTPFLHLANDSSFSRPFGTKEKQ